MSSMECSSGSNLFFRPSVHKQYCPLGESANPAPWKWKKQNLWWTIFFNNKTKELSRCASQAGPRRTTDRQVTFPGQAEQLTRQVRASRVATTCKRRIGDNNSVHWKQVFPASSVVPYMFFLLHAVAHYRQASPAIALSFKFSLSINHIASRRAYSIARHVFKRAQYPILVKWLHVRFQMRFPVPPFHYCSIVEYPTKNASGAGNPFNSERRWAIHTYCREEHAGALQNSHGQPCNLQAFVTVWWKSKYSNCNHCICTSSRWLATE